MVYIKNKENPLIYKQPSEIKVMSNQVSFRRNYLQEFIQKQSEVNSTLKNATNDVNILLNKTKSEQQDHFHHVLKQLEHQESRTSPLIDSIKKQDETYQILLQRIEAIDAFNHELLKKYVNEGIVNQAFVDQLTIQDTVIQQLTKKIEQFDQLNTNMSKKFDNQYHLNDEILKTLELQECFHKTILERLDHQDIANQKTTKELESLKATLSERISYVVDKIEANYKQITGYVAQLFIKTGVFQKIHVEQDEKQKETTSSK